MSIDCLHIYQFTYVHKRKEILLVRIVKGLLDIVILTNFSSISYSSSNLLTENGPSN